MIPEGSRHLLGRQCARRAPALLSGLRATWLCTTLGWMTASIFFAAPAMAEISPLDEGKVSIDAAAELTVPLGTAEPPPESRGSSPPAGEIEGQDVTADDSSPHTALAQEESLREDTTTVAQARATSAQLAEHFLGTAARSVRFDWRRSPVQLGAYVGEILERNNFFSHRYGVSARKAFADVIVEGSATYVATQPTPSSELLALTPYRQYGRPDRFEFELNVGYALAEGVVTQQFSFLPPAEMAFVVLGGARYLFYPEVFADRSYSSVEDFTALATSLVSPFLTDEDRARIEPRSEGGMLVDAARLHTMVGASVDVYFVPGVFFSPRALLSLPLFGLATGSGLGFFWELGLCVGYAL